MDRIQLANSATEKANPTMDLGVRWKLHGDGRTPAPGAVVRPDERLSWPRTIGLGAQHVVAMFGASFVAPVLMGLDPNLAIMMSGVATVIFLLATRGRVPSYLGCSLSFVGVAAVIRAQGGTSATVTGAVFVVVGVVLFLVGVAVQRFGARIIHAAMPPIVTGAVVMLIGFNLAPVTAATYWPQDQWTALLVMAFTGLAVVCLRGFWSRVAIFLGLVFGYCVSWAFDRIFGRIHSMSASGEVTDHWRLDLSAVGKADWVGLPSFHGPTFQWSAILVALPVVIALVAENAGHVKAVGEMTGDPLDDKLGTAISADGVASMLSTAVGGPPNTTYSENIGVMAATRVYSTAAYWAAACFALLFGLCPKFGAIVAAIPGGVLGGITVILYGMIGLLGAQIWLNSGVDLRNPLNLVPAAAGIIIGVGGVSIRFSDNFTLSGIALGTLVVITGYHALRYLAPAHLKSEQPLLDEGTSSYDSPTARVGAPGRRRTTPRTRRPRPGPVPPFWEVSGPAAPRPARDWDAALMGQLAHITTPVDIVVSRLRALDEELPARDGVAVFNRVYLAVTRAVDRSVDAGRFADARAAVALDVRFAERYLAAVDAAANGRRPPACWRPLFQLRRHPGVRPLQFALSGINAHIGHDLALAVVDACRTLDCEPAELEDEFDRVGDLLVSLEERIREELMPGPDLFQIADPLTHLLGSWSLERAREATWTAARALWALRGLPDVAEEFTERLDAAVGLAGRMLLTPLPD